MCTPRLAWLIAGVAALCLLFGAVAVERVPQHAAGQSSPHGILPVGTVPPQIRTAYPPPSGLQAPTPRRPESEAPKDLAPIAKHGGPGSDGRPEHGDGNGHGNSGHDDHNPDDSSQP